MSRSIQDKFYLNHSEEKQKAVLLSLENITPERGKSALLKILEEPPNNTIIIVTATKKDLFPPTILSRCKNNYFAQKKKLI